MPYKDPAKQKEFQQLRYQRMKQDSTWLEEQLASNRVYKLANKEKLAAANRDYHRRKPWVKFHASAWCRCNNPNNKSYRFYGGKGIKCFLTVADLEFLWFRDKAYELKQPSIDRLKSDGHYEVGNCRFIEWVDNVSETWFDSKSGKESRTAQTRKSGVMVAQ